VNARRFLVPLLAAILACAASCSTNAPIYAAPSHRAADLVYVVPFESDASGIRYSGSTDFGALMAEYVAGALQEKGIAAVAVPAGDVAPSDARAIVTGTLTTLDAGSWNLRFWIGFNAGRALVSARVAFERPAGELQFEKDYTARSTTYQFAEAILRRVAAKVARSVAQDVSVH